MLYALAHLPTVLLLRDPFAGPNPLVVLAALGCGLVWGLIVARTGRLPVAIFSHALFTWCVAIQFPLWRLGPAVQAGALNRFRLTPGDLLHLFVGHVEVGVDVLHVVVIVERLGRGSNRPRRRDPSSAFLFLGRYAKLLAFTAMPARFERLQHDVERLGRSRYDPLFARVAVVVGAGADGDVPSACLR